ncbi:MAG TPA: WhiB family transcriptional regulator [Microbacteriaceae bacterium]|nr:WhiB family transcriptional regulator [Microbacteriaceae bacterium]
MTTDLQPHVPDDWFVDPLHTGFPSRPGTRFPVEAGETEDPLAWQADALCAQTDPEIFFPEKGGSTREAKKICEQCPVRQQCLQYALQNDERFGIWGGLSERERRRLRRAG